MKDQELIGKLRKLPVPGFDPAARERAAHRASVALANHVAPTENPARAGVQWGQWLLWGGAFVLAAGFFLRPQAVPVVTRPVAVDTEGSTLRQMEALFPGQINAVIQNGDSVEVALAPTAAQTSDQRLTVKVYSRAGVIEVLSYSGRKICVELDGRKTCFEAFLNSDGGVILAGDDFLWTTSHPATVAGHRVEARSLLSSL